VTKQTLEGELIVRSKPSSVNLSSILVGVAPILTAFLLSACGGKEAPPTVPAGAQAGDLVDMHSCMYETDDAEYAADCGTLVVPENRQVASSRLLTFVFP
jgi:hypothetical protein